MNSNFDDVLVVIPARGGSKGIRKKNSKLLCGKPLVKYTIESALRAFSSKNVCISTDDEEIAKIATDAGLEIPFLRPSELASDQSTTQSVLLHALDFFEKRRGAPYKMIVLLQPTSPFRKMEFFEQAISLYSNECDMVASVHATKSNPYYVLFTEEKGFLNKVSKGSFTRRQDCPLVYELNGNIYCINTKALRSKKMSEFDKIRKLVIPEIYAVDIDNELDWIIATSILEKTNLLEEESF